MALETGNFISALVRTNPLSSDNISEGDDHLQLIKKILQKTFPVGTDSALDSGIGPDQAVQVLIAKSSAPTVDTSASGNAARAMGLLWLDTSNNLLKIRNQANDAWITLSVDPENDKTVDIEGGTIDGTVIGGSTPAAGDFTTLDTTGALTVGTDITISGDDIIMATNTDAYMLVADGTSYNPVAITGDITLTNAGVTSIGADKVITAKILDANVTNAKLDNMAANTVKVRDANSSGVPSDKALATTEILIGDGTGFTAAALSGDATMTNAGAVTVTKIQGEAISSDSVANDQYLKYSSSASEWQKVNVVGDDKLTTKGDLLVYNTVDSETRLGVGTNNKVVTANSSATNGLDWQYVAGDSIRMGSDAAGDVLYFNGTDYARLAKGSADEVLTMNTGATAPEWAAATTGDITGVTAGTGLSGGGTSGSVTLNVEASQTQITAVGTIATGVWNGTDVAVADGGTGSGTASGARTNLGVAIGSDVQAYDAQLADVAGLAVTDGGVIVGDGSNFVLETGATTRTSLGLAIGSDVQAYNADTALTDVAAEWTKTQNFNSTELTFDATQDWDLSANQVCFVTLTANTTFDAPSNQKDGGFYSITLKQDGTGSRTASWNSVFHFAGGTAPTLTTTASAVDIMVFRSDGTNMLEVGRQLDLKTSS